MSLNSVNSVRFRFFAVFGIVALALWVAIAIALQAAEREAMEKASAEGRNLARSLAEHVASSVRVFDLVLLHLRSEWGDGSPRAFAEKVAEQQKFLKEDVVVQISVIRADGRVAYTYLPDSKSADLSDRQYVKVHKERGTDSGRRLPAEEKIALFRIAQEALTNCARHAQAKAVAVELNTESDHLVMSITDDGVGVDLAGNGHNGRGFGLLSMQERAEAIGGSWSIESAPGKGTRVIVRVGAAARV